MLQIWFKTLGAKATLLKIISVQVRRAERPESWTGEATVKPGQLWENIPPKNLGRSSSPNASWKKDWAVSNETMPCRLTPAVFTDTEAGVQTDEENKVTTVPTNNSFSYVKQCIRLHKSSKMGQIRIASWFVMFLSFLSYYPKYHVYRNTPFTWASIPGVSCEAV